MKASRGTVPQIVRCETIFVKLSSNSLPKLLDSAANLAVESYGFGRPQFAFPGYWGRGISGAHGHRDSQGLDLRNPGPDANT